MEFALKYSVDGCLKTTSTVGSRKHESLVPVFLTDVLVPV
jgi:hypothetical protein